MRGNEARSVLAVAGAALCGIMLAGVALGPAEAGVASSAAAARIHWGRVEQVPGVATLNKGYNAAVDAVACWSAGNCAAGGFYTDKHHHGQAFVALERKGRWGKAIEVPGTAALNYQGRASVTSISCARTGVCVAVGTYLNRGNRTRWFTAGERKGRWAKAAAIPDPALTGTKTTTVSCAALGQCGAGGQFVDSTGTTQAWVMTQTGGRWHPAVEVPGIAALNVPGGTADVNAISCPSAGNCSAGGIYTFNANPPPGYFGGASGFVVTETNGVWGSAEQPPALQNYNGGWDAYVTLISCASAGNCAATGYVYEQNQDTASYPYQETFLVTQTHGVWGSVFDAEMNDNGALTCVSAGNCVLGGDWIPSSSQVTRYHDEANGTWGKPGTLSGGSAVSSVSCASPGYCAMGGLGGQGSAFVASEWHGIWGLAVTPAGLPKSYNTAGNRGARTNAIACPPKVTLCLAGGTYSGPKGGFRAFLVSQAR
jgi:hypothetical protein